MVRRLQPAELIVLLARTLGRAERRRRMSDLPDINVWLARVDERHVHHPGARRYWERKASERLGTQPRARPNPLRPAKAWAISDNFWLYPEVFPG